MRTVEVTTIGLEKLDLVKTNLEYQEWGFLIQPIFFRKRFKLKNKV